MYIAGVEDDNLATRRDTIRLHIHNLMEDMYREEEVLKAKLIESVAHCTKELAELCTQLSVPFDAVSTHHVIVKHVVTLGHCMPYSPPRVFHWLLGRKSFAKKQIILQRYIHTYVHDILQCILMYT